jgi:hypothetical protein
MVTKMNIEVPDNDREEPIRNRLQKLQLSFAESMRNIYSYNKYVKTWTKEDEPYIPTIEVPDTQLFLGFSSLKYTPANVVAPPISIISEEGGRVVPKSRVITIIGRKGSGKSVLASIVAQDNFRRKFGIPLIILDPSPTPEWHIHKYALTHKFNSPELAKKLKDYEYKFNVKFQGYSTKVFRPAFDSSFKEEGVDADLKLALTDFKEMYAWSKLDAMQALLEVLELTDNHVAERGAAQILSYPSFTNFDQVIRAIDGELAFGEDQELRNIGTAFASDLRTAMLLDVISKDEGNKDTDLLSDMLHYDSVVFRNKMKTEGDQKMMAKYFVYTKIYLTQILSDRIKWASGTAEYRAKAKLSCPTGICVVIDEADTLCPEGSQTYLKKQIEEIATKYRKAGVNLVLITQNAALLSSVLLAQSDLIICSKIDNVGNAKALKDRGVNDEAINILKHLDVEKKNSYGFKVNEWAVIDQQNQIYSFYPALPLSEFKC